MACSPARSTALRTAALTLLVAAGVTGCGFSGSVDAGGGNTSPGVSSSSAPAPGAAASSSPASSPSSAVSSAATTRPAAASTTPRHASRPSPAPSPEGNGPERCHTGELTASLTGPDAGAGQRYATLVLTDTGGRTCTVRGYGGLGLLDAAGDPVPGTQVRTPVPAPQPVRLQPGQAVAATLHWTVVPSGSEPTSGPCEPTPATLTVIPPDETDALTVPWTAGPVCAAGRIDQTAYAAR